MITFFVIPISPFQEGVSISINIKIGFNIHVSDYLVIELDVFHFK